MLGLILSVGCVAVVDYFDDGIKTPDDVNKRLHLPLLGLIPAVTGERPPVLSADVPHAFGEAFRSLRTSLVFTSGGASYRLFGVTSTQPLEGKTTTASNLALVLALGGARVLLVDADMRRPSVHKTMRLPNAVGLSHGAERHHPRTIRALQAAARAARHTASGARWRGG
jgi:succinoglycan biosynthesis transport protein ExoP